MANKIDLTDEKVISEEEGKKVAEQYGMKFFETSAKSGTGIDDAFDFLTKTLLSQSKTTLKSESSHFADESLELHSDRHKKKRKCCAK